MGSLVCWVGAITAGRFLAYTFKYLGLSRMNFLNLAHQHLLLNHWPIIGTFMGLGLFLVALAARQDDLKKVSLVIFSIVALFAIPTYTSGHAAASLIAAETKAFPGNRGGAPGRGAHGIPLHAGDRSIRMARTVAVPPRLASGEMGLTGRLVLFGCCCGNPDDYRKHRW